jgi:acetyltransferase-like isoleucine patch superfamily enzyme
MVNDESRLAEAVDARLGEVKAAGIQDAVADPGRSALAKYRSLVIGSDGFFDLVRYELVVLLTSWVPGALGLLLRKVAYPWLLGSVGRNVVFGHGVVLRHPRKIRIGDGTIVDDLVVLDAKGSSNTGISVGRNVFLGRASILSCKNGDIVLGDDVNIGFHSEIFSGSTVSVGQHGLFAAYTYLVGGGHEFERGDVPVIQQQRSSKGISLAENVWLGAGAKVLDGVRIGKDVVVGAGAVVTEDLPDGAIAAGVPARVIRRRSDAVPG